MTTRVPHAVWLCHSADLVEGGLALGFSVVVDGHEERAFAVRFEGRVYAYLNRCSHVPSPLDWQENRMFDDTGQWLLCASHGAVYAPDSGACVGGPCNGGLIRIALVEENQQVYGLPGAGMRILPKDSAQ